METIKYEIELPTLPEGCDIAQGIACDGEKAAYWNGSEWEWRMAAKGITYPFIARRRETLADWANKQRLFQALAEARKDHKDTELIYASAGHWTMTNPGHIGGLMGFNLGINPNNLTGKLRLEAGKWVDAT